MAIDPEKLLEMELKRKAESRRKLSDDVLEHVFDTLMLNQKKKNLEE